MLITAAAIVLFGLLALYDAKATVVKSDEDRFRFSRRSQMLRHAIATQTHAEAANTNLSA